MLKAADLTEGQVHETVLVDNLTRTQIVQYAGASGDYNPLHSDEVFATQVAGYPTIFAHGMLTMGMAGRLLTDWVGDGRLLTFGVRFISQVWPGDTLTGKATVQGLRQDGDRHIVDLELEVLNQDGTRVITGTASALVDA
jgi:acyl dehydratase